MRKLAYKLKKLKWHNKKKNYEAKKGEKEKKF